MRYLLLSVLIISLVGIFMISQSDAQQSGINLSWTSLTITSSDGGTTITAGETSAHFEATMVWEGGDPPAFGDLNNLHVNGQINYPDDITAKDKWGQRVAGMPNNGMHTSVMDISSGSFTVIWDAPLRDCPLENVYSEPSCPAGQYTVTFTIDMNDVFDETDETDNTITGTFTVVSPEVPSDAPTVNVPADIVVESPDGTAQEITFVVTATDDVGVTSGPICQYREYGSSSIYNLDPSSFPGGQIVIKRHHSDETITITCTASDADGNTGTGTFTVNVTYTPPADTTPPIVNVPADIVVESPDGTAQEITFVAETSTFLKLDSFAPIPKSGQIHRTVDIFGQLLTIDRQSTISGAEIKLVFTGFTYAGKDHYKITTDNNGKFDWSNIIPIGEGYAIQAVYDGSSNFKSSKSQTEYFDVRTSSQPQTTAPTEDSSPAGGVALLVIIMIVVIVAIAIKKRKKKIPVTIPPPSGGGIAGTATIAKAFISRKIPRAGKAPLLMGKIRQAKSAVGRQSPKAKKRKDVMHYLRCKQCHLEEFLENEADGQQHCTKCDWRKQ